MKAIKEKRIISKYGFKLAVLFAIFLLSFLLSVRLGSVFLSTKEFFAGLFRLDGYETESIIIYTLRLPRALGAILCGVGLSLSGVLLQAVTDNHLASPNIIGVNAGAGFTTVIFLALCPTLSLLSPFIAFIGGFLATLLIISLSGRRAFSKSTVLLAGIALNALLNAGISFITLLDTDVLSSYNAFSIGGINGVSIKNLVFPAAIILFCLTLCMIFAKRIDILCLGDAYASSLGVNVRALRIICIICASALAGAVVSFAGLIGFVGLIVPHIARHIVGGRTERLLPVSAVTGSIIVLLGDLLGRIIISPSEIPVGIMMALIGAPFFIVLLIKYRGECR